MKAHEAAMVAGTMSNSGETPTAVLSEAIIGSTTCVVAVFDVSSVRKVINVQIASTINRGCSP